MAGRTQSPDFPSSNAIDHFLSGRLDGFFAIIDADGRSLPYSTYLGGTGKDVAQAVAIDASGRAYVVGATDSTDLVTKSPATAGPLRARRAHRWRD